MKIINPATITDAMITSAPEDATAAWTAGTYAIGDERHVVATHKVYKCAIAGASSVSPELDPTRWAEMRWTNRWACFVRTTTQASKGTTSLTVKVRPGFCNAAAFYGLVGTSYTLTVTDGAGGPTIYTRSGMLYRDAVDWYDVLFGPLDQQDRLFFTGIPLVVDPEIILTVTSATGNPVAVGMFDVGDLQPLYDESSWGGLLAGSNVDVVTKSRIKLSDDGTELEIKNGAAANTIKGDLVMPREALDAVMLVLRRVHNVPVSVIGVTKRPYAQQIHTFGIVQGSGTYDVHGRVSLTVPGIF